MAIFRGGLLQDFSGLLTKNGADERGQSEEQKLGKQKAQIGNGTTRLRTTDYGQRDGRAVFR
jgi:hypothetical protein